MIVYIVCVNGIVEMWLSTHLHGNKSILLHTEADEDDDDEEEDGIRIIWF